MILRWKLKKLDGAIERTCKYLSEKVWFIENRSKLSEKENVSCDGEGLPIAMGRVKNELCEFSFVSICFNVDR